MMKKMFFVFLIGLVAAVGAPIAAYAAPTSSSTVGTPSRSGSGDVIGPLYGQHIIVPLPGGLLGACPNSTCYGLFIASGGQVGVSAAWTATTYSYSVPAFSVTVSDTSPYVSYSAGGAPGAGVTPGTFDVHPIDYLPRTCVETGSAC